MDGETASILLFAAGYLTVQKYSVVDTIWSSVQYKAATALVECSLTGLEIKQSVVVMGHTIRLSWGDTVPEHERPSSDVTSLGLGPCTSREGVFYKACWDNEGCHNKVKLHFYTVQSWHKHCLKAATAPKRKWKAVVSRGMTHGNSWINLTYSDIHASRSTPSRTKRTWN